MTREAQASTSRIDWIDAGRGLAITLVVMFHATNWLGEAGFAVEGWSEFNSTIASIRLPLFFTMAGLLARKWPTASWRSLWSSKLSLFIWVYAVWSVIATFSFMLGLDLQEQQGNYFAQFRDLLLAPVLPRFELWFIWALALFFVLAKLIRKAPPALQLSLSGLVSVIALSGFLNGNAGWMGIAKYFFFFIAGLLLRRHVLRWGTASWWASSASVAFWAGLLVLGRVLNWSSLPGYYFVSCIAGVAAGVAVSRVLALIPGTRYLGSRTLPIYLTHTSVILVLAWILWHVEPSVQGSGWVPLLPVIVSALAIATSLLISRAVRMQSPLRYLYEQPSWFARRQ